MKWMKRTFLLIGLMALLTACVPAPTMNPPAKTQTGVAQTGTGSDDINEATPKTTDSLEIKSSAPSVPLRAGIDSAIIVGNDTDHFLGKAKQILTMYLDYECEYCHEFASRDLSWIEQTYAGPSRLDINRVVVAKSPAGELMAKTAICGVRLLDTFDTVDHELWTHPLHSESDLPLFAKHTGLSLQDLRSCLKTPYAIDGMKSMKQLTEQSGFNRFPGFEIGTEKWIGIKTRADLQATIEKALK